MQLRTPLSNRQASAFTLIEMIGVLAVIAILAALLIPKVFEAINNARINSATVSYNTVKTALTDHYAKYGSLLATTNSTTLTVPVAGYDKMLISEGYLDKPFQTQIGDNTATSVEAVAGLSAATTVTGINSAYDLDGSDPAVNDAAPAGTVVQAVIPAVAEADARDLNTRLDGLGLAAGAVGTADIKGRVKYAAPAAPGGPVTVYIYVTHR